MAENKPTVNLNKAWLQDFLTDDVGPFRRDILALGEAAVYPVGGETVPPMVDLMDDGRDAAGFRTGQKRPLAIGNMAGGESGDRSNGDQVVLALNEVIGQLDGIIKQQTELFEEIEENITTSMDTLFKNQDDSLVKIEGSEFVDVFSDVDGILSETPGEGSEDDD